MTLAELPVELLSCILFNLGFRDVLRCRAVCAKLRDLVDKDVRTRYKIELAVAGMEDGWHSTLTISKRLAVLKERQDAWKQLAWRSQHDIPITSRTALQKLHGGVLAQEEDPKTLHFWQLPSQIRGIASREWTLDVGEVRMSDFGMDPTQDLLVLVEERGSSCCVHLRSMSTGVAHPMAASGGTLMHTLDYGLTNTYSMRISDAHLVLHITNDAEDMVCELLVWNWKTGVVLRHITEIELAPLVFLAPSYLLLLVLHPTSVDNGTKRTTIFGPCLIVLDLDRPSPEQVPLIDLEYLCAFTYPVLHRECTVTHMTLYCEPGPGWRPPPALQVPFSVSAENRLLVAHLQVVRLSYNLWFLSNLLSFIPSETLLSAVRSLPPGQTGKVFAWQDWGVYGSRLQVARDFFDKHPSAYGTSFAYSAHAKSLYEPSLIEVYDFDALAVRRALSSSQNTKTARSDNSTLVTTLTALSGWGSDIFKDAVITDYPYFRRTVTMETAVGEPGVTFDRLLLGEDSIVLVSSEEVNNNPLFRVLTF